MTAASPDLPAPMVINGDARNLAELATAQFGLDCDGQLTATITSPPYADLIDYGSANQIGHGQSLDEYLEDCRGLFESVFRLTKPDGVMWLVVDSYLDGSPHGNGVSGLRFLPFTLASLAESVGWTLREIVIWHKDRTRPWTHRGKFRNAFEHVLLLVKGPDFKFRADRLRDNQDLARWWVRYPERYNVFGKIPDNVWHIPIPTQGSWSGKAYRHACPLPPELVRRMILLTTDEGDTVLDPFAGVGTVPSVAAALGRRGVGVELNADFVASFNDHVREEVAALVDVAGGDGGGGPSPEKIAHLRMLKYSKAVFVKVREANPHFPSPSLLICESHESRLDDAKGRSVGSASWFFVYSHLDVSLKTEIEAAVSSIESVAPFTKYGLDGKIRVIQLGAAGRRLRGKSWSVYEHGRTWNVSREVAGIEVAKIPISRLRGAFPPVVSNLKVSIDLDHVGDVAAADPTRQGVN